MGTPVPAGEFEDHLEIVGELAALMVARKAITFGKTRGRGVAPYHLDLAHLASGQDCFAVGRAMALTIRHYHGDDVGCLFGVSAHGIPVAVLAAQYYALLCGTETPWAVNPANLAEGAKVVLVDDLLTTGSAIQKTISDLKQIDCAVAGVMVLVDTLARAKNKLIGLEIERDTGVPVRCCANIVEVLHNIKLTSLPEDQQAALTKYLTAG